MIEIKQTFASKMVLVKVDLCRRRNCHFIEINLPAVVDGNLQVIILAVNELHERASAVVIRKKIVSYLAKLDILETQICSLTTGSNVLKAGQLMRTDFALPENFADENDEDKCDVTEASDSELWEDVITAKDGFITIRYHVHTLQLSVRDFFKANFSAKEVVSKGRNVAKKTQKQNIRKLFKHNNKLLPKLDETR